MYHSAAVSVYAQRLMDLQRSLDAMVAVASALVHSPHRPAMVPATAGSSGQTQALLSACLSAMYARAPASQRVPVLHASRSLVPSILPMLPALSTVLPPQQACPQPAASSDKSPGLAVHSRKKYRNRFSLDEEAALVAFWYTHRFKYSVKSKILWRLAERSGVTERDAISVQKHFDHNLKHGRMRELFRSFRRKGRLADIIDSIDVDKDFDTLPIAGGDTRSSSEGEEGQLEASTVTSAASSDAEGAEHLRCQHN